MWQWITVSPSSKLFPMVQKVMRQVPYPKETVTIQTKGKDINKYKFDFQWQNEDVCGIDIYKEIPDERTNSVVRSTKSKKV